MGMAGRLFFGSLCAGTFGLGTWQTLRYRDKVALVEQRSQDLQQEPVVYGSAAAAAHGSTSKDARTNYRRLQFTGRFQHEREFLIGPRGPPKDALPQGPGTSSGGLSSAPQGFLVLTPMVLTTNDIDNNNDAAATILVNRGWVPMQQVNSSRYGRSQSQQRYQQLRNRGDQTTNSPSSPQESSMLHWDRPPGDVTITVVPGTFEGEWNVDFALLL
jgi:cytochrome oxidase assembly protein ShyY1